MDRALLKVSIKHGLAVSILTLVIYVLLGYCVRLFQESWRPLMGSMEGHYGMLVGLFVGTFFFHTWIKYDYLKKKKLMKDRHDLIVKLIKERGNK